MIHYHILITAINVFVYPKKNAVNGVDHLLLEYYDKKDNFLFFICIIKQNVSSFIKTFIRYYFIYKKIIINYILL
jgi:hypothetical protein